MFARNNLKNHPDLADIYYQLLPENRPCDRQIHKKPDFGDPDQVYHDFYTTPCYEAAFAYLHQTIPASAGVPAGRPRAVDPDRICRIICDLVRFYGGCDTGFIKLAPTTITATGAGMHKDGEIPWTRATPPPLSLWCPWISICSKTAPQPQ